MNSYAHLYILWIRIIISHEFMYEEHYSWVLCTTPSQCTLLMADLPSPLKSCWSLPHSRFQSLSVSLVAKGTHTATAAATWHWHQSAGFSQEHYPKSSLLAPTILQPGQLPSWPWSSSRTWLNLIAGIDPNRHGCSAQAHELSLDGSALSAGPNCWLSWICQASGHLSGCFWPCGQSRLGLWVPWLQRQASAERSMRMSVDLSTVKGQKPLRRPGSITCQINLGG